MKPPNEIDDAKVLYWAWSGAAPFGSVKFTDGEIAAEIYGLALCSYVRSDEVYRFSCDANWETRQDDVYGSVQEAIEKLPLQYRQVTAHWIEMQ